MDDILPPGATYSIYAGPYGDTYGIPPFPVDGLSMSPDGLVTGIPTTASAGSFQYVVSSGDGYYHSANQCFQVGASAGTSSCIAMGTLWGTWATDDTEIDLPAPAVTGNVGRVTWSVFPGAVPMTLVP